MARECWTFEHPAALGLAARADSLGELFEALGEGLAGQICSARAVRAERTRRVRAQAEDVESLLVEFLSALLGLFHLERWLAGSVRVVRADETSVEADVTGETYDPKRHAIDVEIKAVTYHQLRVGREADAWTASVILDI